MIGPLAAIVLAAFATEAAVGFGSTVLTVTLGAHLYPLDVLLPAFVPLNLVLSAYLVGRYREAIDWRLLGRRILPFTALGLLAGIAVFRHEPAARLKLPLGLFIAALALVELLALRQSAAPAPLPRGVGEVVLVGGGVVHGLFASGGPLVVYYAGRSLHDKRAFRATLSALWLLLNLALVASYASRHLIDARTIHMSLWLAPSLGLGVLGGEWLHGRLRPARFRLFLYLVLLGAGASLAVRSLASHEV